MPDDSANPPSPGHHLLVGVLASVLLLIALVIVIPNLLISHRTPGEASSVSGVRTLNTAEVVYANNYPRIGFSPTLAVLGSGGTDCSHPTAEHACLIDDTLASGAKSGYRFRYTVAQRDGVGVAYTLRADPVPHELIWWERVLRTEPPSDRHFFSDESAVIRSEKGREAGPNSQPLN